MGSVSQPIRNVLLQAAEQDASRLTDLVTRIDVRANDTLIALGGSPHDVYFPEDAVLSFVSQLGDGKSIEVASVGRNGSTAALSMLGGHSAMCGVTVSVPGRIARVSVSECMCEIDASPLFAAAVANHARDVFRQTQQSAACVAFHSVEARVATWLLVTSERAGGGRIVAAHHTIARLLGVRRASVSDAAMRLRTQGRIEYLRGSFRVLDAEGLRDVACCCHAQLSSTSEVVNAADTRPASAAPRPPRATAFAPMTRAQMRDVRQRTVAARQAVELAVRHCGTFIQHSNYRISKSGRALDESERVVQQLRRAVEFYTKALNADHESAEAAITMVTRLVDEAEAPATDKGMLRAAAAQWAMGALEGAPASGPQINLDSRPAAAAPTSTEFAAAVGE